MVFSIFPHWSDVAWLHAWWLIVVAAGTAIVRVAYFRHPPWSAGCLATVSCVINAPRVAGWMLTDQNDFMLLPIVVAGCAVVAALLPWQRPPRLWELLDRSAIAAVIALMTIPAVVALCLLLSIVLQILSGIG